MARRRKQDGSDIGLFLFVLAILGVIVLTVAIFASPIILLFSLLIYEIRAGVASQNFAFASDETEALSEFEGKLNAIRVRLSDIGEKGSHLKQNVDGMYHRGSKLGLALNAELEELNPREENLQMRVDKIRQKPIDRLDKWSRLASIRFALRATIAAYLGIGFILYQLDPLWMHAFSSLVGQYVLLHLHFRGVSDVLYGSGLVSALSAAVLFPIFYFNRHSMLDRSTERLRQRLLETPEEEHSTDHNDADREEEQDEASEDESETTDDDSAGQVKPWHEILGVLPTASPKEINAAWRELIKKSHPDRVADLDADFQTLAEEKSRMLNTARDEGLSRH